MHFLRRFKMGKYDTLLGITCTISQHYHSGTFHCVACSNAKSYSEKGAASKQKKNLDIVCFNE